MPEFVVIEDQFGARATVDARTAVAIHVPRGATIMGPAVGPGDTRTVQEAADQAAAITAAAQAALVAPEDPGPTKPVTPPKRGAAATTKP